MTFEWAYGLRVQCKQADVASHLKQWVCPAHNISDRFPRATALTCRSTGTIFVVHGSHEVLVPERSAKLPAELHQDSALFHKWWVKS
jgi:hypothetical protein